MLLILLPFPLLLTLLFSFFFTAEGSYNKTIVFLFGSVSVPFFFSIPGLMACFCAAFVCIVFLFGNYVKDEPPKENALWMIQRDTGINRNLAKSET